MLLRWKMNPQQTCQQWWNIMRSPAGAGSIFNMVLSQVTHMKDFIISCGGIFKQNNQKTQDYAHEIEGGGASRGVKIRVFKTPFGHSIHRVIYLLAPLGKKWLFFKVMSRSKILFLKCDGLWQLLHDYYTIIIPGCDFILNGVFIVHEKKKMKKKNSRIPKTPTSYLISISPATLVATQTYRPESEGLALMISILRPCSRRRRFSPAFTGDPSFSQVSEGGGWPAASHSSTRVLLTTTFLSTGPSTLPAMEGGTGGETFLSGLHCVIYVWDQCKWT